jgi:hypothetical protein
MTESTAAIEAIETDKDTWIYTFGSQQLQYNRTLGYECQQKYLDERIKLEYPGFVIANARVKRVDYPSMRYGNLYSMTMPMSGNESIRTAISLRSMTTWANIN